MQFHPLKSGMLACFTLLLLSGCTTLSPEGPFSEVAQDVELRLGKHISWKPEGPEDPVVVAKIDQLLARPLTAERAVQIALLNNRDLRALYADIGLAQANLVQTELWKNPVIDGAVTFSSGGGAPDYTFKAALKLIDILYIPLRARVAASQLDEAKLDVTGQVMSVAGLTYIAFLDYLALRQSTNVLSEAVKTASATVETGKALRQAGNISDYDYEQEVAQQVQIAAELARAQVNVAQARERVNRLMGVTGPQTQWRSSDHLPAISGRMPATDDMEARAIEASVDLALLRQRIITMGRRYRVADITSLLPQLDVGGQAERTVGENEAGPTFTVELPLFDWGQAKRASAVMELSRAGDRFTALAVRIRSFARLHRARMISSRQTAAYYRDSVLPQAQRLVQSAERQYNVMQLGVFQLLQARDRQVRVSQEYVSALATYWKDRARLLLILAAHPDRQSWCDRSSPDSSAWAFVLGDANRRWCDPAERAVAGIDGFGFCGAVANG